MGRVPVPVDSVDLGHDLSLARALADAQVRQTPGEPGTWNGRQDARAVTRLPLTGRVGVT